MQAAWPELIGTARINQPRGHVQVGAVLRTDTLNDGQYLDRTYAGYAGTISGDTHPFSGNLGPLGEDDLGFRMKAGTESAGEIANGMGLVTNFGAPTNVSGLGFVNPLSGPFPAGWNARGSTQSLRDTGSLIPKL